MRGLVVLSALLSLSLARNIIRGQHGFFDDLVVVRGSSVVVFWWRGGQTSGDVCAKLGVFPHLCFFASVCPWYENYSLTALMCNDRETLLVPLFECHFRLLVKDRVGVGALL
jgi:hypothetical protein